MENSKAYKSLLEQFNASGSEKLDGYNSQLIEEIYDWEREEIEDTIWRNFHQRKDMDLAVFLPKLEKYDGVGALKKALGECMLPSAKSIIISQVLYQYTGDAKYLDVIKENIDEDKNNISYVAILSYCKPCRKSYEMLVDIYLKSDNKTIRSTAVTGILYNKGIMTDPCNLQEIMDNIELSRKFISDDMKERERIIVMFESGQL